MAGSQGPARSTEAAPGGGSDGIEGAGTAQASAPASDPAPAPAPAPAAAPAEPASAAAPALATSPAPAPAHASGGALSEAATEVSADFAGDDGARPGAGVLGAAGACEATSVRPGKSAPKAAPKAAAMKAAAPKAAPRSSNPSLGTLMDWRVDVLKSTDLITSGSKADGKALRGLKRFYIRERAEGEAKAGKEELLLEAQDNLRGDGHWQYAAFGRFEYLNDTSGIMDGECVRAER